MPAEELSISMSQINLREQEFKGLKEENNKLKPELTLNIEEKNKLSSEKNQLWKKVNELKKKVIGKTPFQGAKHLIWDTLAIEITKFRPYLNYVNDKKKL